MKKRILLLAISLLIGGCAGNNNPSVDINTTNSSITSTISKVTTGESTTNNVTTSTITPSTPTPTTPTPSTPTPSTPKPSTATPSTLSPSTPIPNTSSGTTSSSTTEEDDFIMIDNIKGNGETWPKEIKALIDKTTFRYNNQELIQAVFIDAEYYNVIYTKYSSYYQDYVSITCENSISATTAECIDLMISFSSILENEGFIFNEAYFTNLGIFYASKKIKNDIHFVIQISLQEISRKSTKYESFYGLNLCFTYSRPLLTDYNALNHLKSWPLTEIKEIVNQNIPEPSITYSYLMGTKNTIIDIDEKNNISYYPCYVLRLHGANKESESLYMDLLKSRNFEITTYDDENGAFAFNNLNQIAINFFYSQENIYTGNLDLYIYLKS